MSRKRKDTKAQTDCIKKRKPNKKKQNYSTVKIVLDMQRALQRQNLSECINRSLSFFFFFLFENVFIYPPCAFGTVQLFGQKKKETFTNSLKSFKPCQSSDGTLFS